MIDLVNKAINRKLDSISFTEIVIGTVTSTNPFKIRINDRIEIGLEFIEPSSLGISDDSPLPSLPLTAGDKVQMVRYNRGQRFYVLTGFKELYDRETEGLEILAKSNILIRQLIMEDREIQENLRWQ